MATARPTMRWLASRCPRRHGSTLAQADLPPCSLKAWGPREESQGVMFGHSQVQHNSESTHLEMATELSKRLLLELLATLRTCRVQEQINNPARGWWCFPISPCFFVDILPNTKIIPFKYIARVNQHDAAAHLFSGRSFSSSLSD